MAHEYLYDEHIKSDEDDTPLLSASDNNGVVWWPYLLIVPILALLGSCFLKIIISEKCNQRRNSKKDTSGNIGSVSYTKGKAVTVNKFPVKKESETNKLGNTKGATSDTEVKTASANKSTHKESSVVIVIDNATCTQQSNTVNLDYVSTENLKSITTLNKKHVASLSENDGRSLPCKAIGTCQESLQKLSEIQKITDAGLNISLMTVRDAMGTSVEIKEPPKHTDVVVIPIEAVTKLKMAKAKSKISKPTYSGTNLQVGSCITSDGSKTSPTTGVVATSNTETITLKEKVMQTEVSSKDRLNKQDSPKVTASDPKFSQILLAKEVLTKTSKDPDKKEIATTTANTKVSKSIEFIGTETKSPNSTVFKRIKKVNEVGTSFDKDEFEKVTHKIKNSILKKDINQIKDNRVSVTTTGVQSIESSLIDPYKVATEIISACNDILFEENDSTLVGPVSLINARTIKLNDNIQNVETKTWHDIPTKAAKEYKCAGKLTLLSKEKIESKEQDTPLLNKHGRVKEISDDNIIENIDPTEQKHVFTEEKESKTCRSRTVNETKTLKVASNSLKESLSTGETTTKEKTALINNHTDTVPDKKSIFTVEDTTVPTVGIKLVEPISLQEKTNTKTDDTTARSKKNTNGANELKPNIMLPTDKVENIATSTMNVPFLQFSPLGNNDFPYSNLGITKVNIYVGTDMTIKCTRDELLSSSDLAPPIEKATKEIEAKTNEFLKDSEVATTPSLSVTTTTDSSTLTSITGSVNLNSIEVATDDVPAMVLKDIGVKVNPSVHFTSDDMNFNNTCKPDLKIKTDEKDNKKEIVTDVLDISDTKTIQNLSAPANITDIPNAEVIAPKKLAVVLNETKKILKDACTAPMKMASVRFKCDNIDVDKVEKLPKYTMNLKIISMNKKDSEKAIKDENKVKSQSPAYVLPLPTSDIIKTQSIELPNPDGTKITANLQVKNNHNVIVPSVHFTSKDHLYEISPESQIKSNTEEGKGSDEQINSSDPINVPSPELSSEDSISSRTIMNPLSLKDITFLKRLDIPSKNYTIDSSSKSHSPSTADTMASSVASTEVNIFPNINDRVLTIRDVESNDFKVKDDSAVIKKTSSSSDNADKGHRAHDAAPAFSVGNDIDEISQITHDGNEELTKQRGVGDIIETLQRNVTKETK